MRRFAIITALTAMFAVTAAPALAQDAYPPDVQVSCSVSTGTPTQGETITFTCGGWLPDSEVTATIFSHGQLLATLPVDEEGQVQGQVTIPEDLRPGAHTLRIAGLDASNQQQHFDTRIVVRPDQAAANPDRPAAAAGLPATGSDAVVFGALALGLLSAGGGALYAARRKSAGLADN